MLVVVAIAALVILGMVGYVQHYNAQQEQERIAAERFRLEQERIARETAQQERLAKEKAEKERLEKEQARQQRERLGREKRELARLQNEREERARNAEMEQVIEFQKLANKLAFGVPVNGLIQGRTLEALKFYQHTTRREVTGNIDEQLLIDLEKEVDNLYKIKLFDQHSDMNYKQRAFYRALIWGCLQNSQEIIANPFFKHPDSDKGARYVLAFDSVSNETPEKDSHIGLHVTKVLRRELINSGLFFVTTAFNLRGVEITNSQELSSSISRQRQIIEADEGIPVLPPDYIISMQVKRSNANNVSGVLFFDYSLNITVYSAEHGLAVYSRNVPVKAVAPTVR